jgi:hypothetical protein
MHKDLAVMLSTAPTTRWSLRLYLDLPVMLQLKCDVVLRTAAAAAVLLLLYC